MSQTEYHTGKLTPLPLVNNCIETTCLVILQEAGLADRIGNRYTAHEALMDELYDDYVIVKEKLYKITSTSSDPDADIANAKLNDDGTIDFEVKFYNGGTCISEMINKAISKIKPTESDDNLLVGG